jgi:membrane protein DedA with SNARE-associated domain
MFAAGPNVSEPGTDLMDQFVQNLLTSADGKEAYLLIFGVLVLCGFGLPLPEDVSLIAGGYLVSQDNAKLIPMMLAGYLGIIVGDTCIHLMGRRLGSRVTQVWPFRLLLSEEKHARVEEYFHRYGQWTVMVARFLPGLRAMTYFTAGTARMKYWRFLLFDGIAALVSAPVFVYLGNYFGDDIDQVIHKARRSQAFALVLVVCVVIVWASLRAARNRIRARQIPPDSPAQVPPPAIEAPHPKTGTQ